MSVKRYEMKTKYRGKESWDELEESPDGMYVRYEDFVASQREFRAADATIENLQMQVEKLAAENAGLIEQAEEVYAAGYNHGHLNSVDRIAYADYVKDDFYGLAVELMREAETPATDAFLAEVRAQGVDLAIAELNQLAERSEKEAPVGAGHHRSAALFLQLISTQLRNGGAE